MRISQLVFSGVLAIGLSGQAWAEDLSFLLTNESDLGIVGFYVSATDSPDWEENLLDGGILESGYEIDVIIADGLTTCTYDIRTEFENGDAFEDFELDLCEMGGYVFE